MLHHNASSAFVAAADAVTTNIDDISGIPGLADV